MKEVEIKIQLNNIIDTIKLLEQQGCVFSEPVVQEDLIFIPNHEPTVPVPPGVNVLRIRKQKNKTIFTLKQSDFGNNLSKTEIETEIMDAKSMEKAILHLEYKLVAVVKKSRQKCQYKEYEICVDEVDGLGAYLEVEKITDENPRTIQADMFTMLDTLGIKNSQPVEFGYDVLYVKKYGNKG